MPKTVELSINGSFYLTFKPIADQEQESDEVIYDKLQNGNYIIGLNSKQVFKLEGWKPIYKFEMDVSNSAEYYWDLLDEEDLEL